MYTHFFKRFIDLIGSFIGLLLTSPIFIIVVIYLLFANKGKPFYFQERPGFNGQLFKIIKFKTMNDKKDDHGNLLPDVERITSIGRIVRKYSLDEIPQLINVLKGDMSLIGPRPLLKEYISLYNKEEMQRHNVKPGITGWAQINGRNSISWAKKFSYDLYYVNHLSFFLDFKIILLTIKKVILREGVNSDDNDTMPDFTGTEESNA